jgi:tRNA nucleotidyltransferase/poly(A) polymerase
MENWKTIAKELLPNEFNEFMEFGGSGRRPDEVEFTTIEQDVKRRDLTINALFFDIDTGEVVDLVGGINDLKNGVVRTVGKAEDRFGEDRLRILRAIRFAGRFGSELDPAVDKALTNDNSLEGVSGERVRDEFLKGLKTAKSVKHFMQLITKYTLWDWIFQGIPNINVKPIEERDPAVLIAWILAPNNANELAKALNRLTYTNDEAKAVSFLVSLRKFKPNSIVHFKKGQQRYGLSDEQIRSFAQLISLDMKLIDALLKFELSVTGQDAMDAGIEKGQMIGKFINQKENENFNSLLNT